MAARAALRPGVPLRRQRTAGLQRTRLTPRTGHPSGGDKVQQFTQLMLCSRSTVQNMSRQCPPLLELDTSALMGRLMAYKDCLPDCDLITLLKAQPRYFFGSSEAGTVARISQNLDALEAALAAVTDVPQVVEERPELLFLEPQQLQESLDCISDLQLSTISPPDVAVLVLTFCRP